MRRSESQSLYSALPGAYINYSSNPSEGSIFKDFDRRVIRVAYWNTRPISESDIYYPKIVSQILPDLYTFSDTEKINVSLDDSLSNLFHDNQRSKVNFCEADIDQDTQIIGHINPKMFYCPKCGKIKNLKDDKDIKDMVCSCHGETKKMNQYNRIWVCTCGKAYPLEVDTTKYRYFAYLQDGFLNNNNEQEWLRDKTCSCGSRCKLINSTDPKCFYPRTITSVKLTENKTAELCVSQRGRDLILDKQLKKISENEFNELAKNIIDTPIDAGNGVSPLDGFLGRFQQVASSQRAKYNVSEDVVYKILEYNTLRTKEKDSLNSAINNILAAGNIAERNDILNALDKLKIKDIISVNNIEIINTAYGYTRRYQSPDEINDNDKFNLCAFPTYGESNKHTFYNTRVLTEGILIDIDKKAIFEYLKNKYSLSENFYFGDIADSDLDLWFMDTKNIDTSLIKMFSAIENDGTATSYYTKDTYSILHTIAHMFINSISKFCGIDKSSLSEMIFTNTCSIFIYSQSNQGAVLGALTDMFKKDLHKVINSVYYDNLNCIFDPLCMTTSNGSCCACSYIDEVACEHFNKDLSRKYLYGYGTQGSDEYYENFWEE